MKDVKPDRTDLIYLSKYQYLLTYTTNNIPTGVLTTQGFLPLFTAVFLFRKETFMFEFDFLRLQ
jgi:hypothetical protein